MGYLKSAVSVFVRKQNTNLLFFTHIINMDQYIHDSVCYKLPQKHVSCVVALADMFFYHNEHCVLSL